MTYRTVILLCVILLLGACGKSDDKPAELFKDQIDTLDKAKAVEGTLQKQSEAQRKMIEQQAK